MKNTPIKVLNEQKNPFFFVHTGSGKLIEEEYLQILIPPKPGGQASYCSVHYSKHVPSPAHSKYPVHSQTPVHSNTSTMCSQPQETAPKLQTSSPCSRTRREPQHWKAFKVSTQPAILYTP